MPGEKAQKSPQGTVMHQDIPIGDIVFHDSVKRDHKDYDVVVVTPNPASDKTFIFQAGYPAYERFAQAGVPARCLVAKQPLAPGAYTLLTRLTGLVRAKSKRSEQIPLLAALQKHHEFTHKALACVLGIPVGNIGVMFANDRLSKRRKAEQKKVERALAKAEKKTASEPAIVSSENHVEGRALSPDLSGGTITTSFLLIQELWDAPRTLTAQCEYEDFLTFIARLKKAFPGVPPSFEGWANRVIAKGKGFDPLPLRRILNLPVPV